MKIGDKVRFLSEVGGGRVAGFQGKDIVLVEDEDGFDVPMRITEVVVIGEEDYDTKHMVEVKGEKGKAKSVEPEEEPETEPADRPVTFKAPVEERKGGDKLSAYLAFVPIDVKELSNTRFDSYLVNDCNYYLRYVYMTAEGTSWQVRSQGEVEPNTKLFIEEFGRDQLNLLEHSCIQLIAYKRDKTFGIIAHEMTHIWEYNNEDFKKVRKTNEDLVEGLAVWTDLFLCEKSGMTNAAKQRNSWLARDDEYGRGLRFIMENCPDDPYGYIQVQASKMR